MNFIYIFCSLIIRTATNIFFKKIKIVGLENISKDTPVFLYGNHNNAFFDSIVVHFALNENVYTLTRGDVFSSKFTAYLLSKFHILPIYRMQEGFENLHKNTDTFSKTTLLLKQKNKVLIFPEGNCIQEKNLRNFKKGMARMAFATELETNFELGLHMQPIAINYTKPAQFRSSYEIVIGKMIELKKFEADYKQNPSVAINKFNAECQQVLAEMMVIVENKNNENLHELLCQINANNQFMLSSKSIATMLNKLPHETVDALNAKKISYNNFMQKHKIRDWVVCENENGYGKATFYSLVLLFLLPLYVVGLLLNYITFKLPFLIAKKTCKNIEFFTSINLASGAFLWVINFIIYTIVLSVFITNGYLFMLAALAMPATGILALWYWEKLKKIMGKFRWLKLTRNDELTTAEILKLRSEIVALFFNAQF